MTIEQVDPEETKDWIPIQIEGPLPNMVALALIQAVGKMWPEAAINGKSHYALEFRVPPNVEPEDLDQEFADAIRAGVDDDHEKVDFLGFREGYVAFAPPEELCLALGNVAHAIFKSHEPEAVNHVEWTVLTGKEPDDPKYVLSISVGKDKTPLAMRKKAEAEVERLKAILNQEGISY